MGINGYQYEVTIHEIYREYDTFKRRIAYIIDDYEQHTYTITMTEEQDFNQYKDIIDSICNNKKFQYNIIPYIPCPFLSFRTWFIEELEDNQWYIQAIDNECETYECINVEDTIKIRYRVFNKHTHSMIASIPSSKVLQNIKDILDMNVEYDGYNIRANILTSTIRIP